MPENPFSDSVPTHMAIAATVYTAPLVELSETIETNRAKLLLVRGSYGNGKSHALERLKNDVNINKPSKFAVYCSAFAAKSLRRIYEQVCTELASGKYSKLESSPEGRIILESKGLPSKIVDLFYNKDRFRKLEEIKPDLAFGKVVASSADAVSFLCALAVMVDQFILLIDDIEEATTMERSERQAFLGHIRALYDQAIRSDLNVILAMAITPAKEELIRTDRQDLIERVDKIISFEKPTFKEFSNIIEKRLEVSALEGELEIATPVLNKVWKSQKSIRAMFNILRDSVEKAYNDEELKITDVKIEEAAEVSSKKVASRESKPADDIIISILTEETGLQADEIVKRSKKSGSWMKHRLADMVASGILRKEQKARNRPAYYFLAKGSK